MSASRYGVHSCRFTAALLRCQLMFSGLRTASRCAFVLTSTRRGQYNLRVQRHCCRPSVRVMASDEASAAKKAAESGSAALCCRD